MKQLSILSGKGGTGKTTVTGSFAALSENTVFADCDVDASNLHLLLNPTLKETHEFKGLELAVIDDQKCIHCGRCQELCRFNAINNYYVDPIHCEGCGVCVRFCPVEAISFNERVCGHAYISDTKYGPLSHARLIPGMENSGKLVTQVRKNAKSLAEKYSSDLVLVDGPPGIGCPVIASLSEIDATLVVVEPTLSGIHDLERVLQLLRHFNIEPLVTVNKFDLNVENTEKIEEYAIEEDIRIMGRIPFDSQVTEAMVNGQPIVEYRPRSAASSAIHQIFENIQDFLST